MVSENKVEEIVLALEDEQLLEEVVETIKASQPDIIAFLSQESARLLTEEEYSLLWYLVAAIMHSWGEEYGSVPTLSSDALGEREELLWTWIDKDVKQPFANRLDAFFEATEEEELMALVEDLTVPDEDYVVTEIGRPILVAMAATVIVCLSDQH